MRLRSVADGRQVNIPVLGNWSEVGTEKAKRAGCWKSQFKLVGRILRETRVFTMLRSDDDCTGRLVWEEADAKLPRKATKR